MKSKLVALLLLLKAATSQATCDTALQACGELVNTQDHEITVLKNQVSTLEDRLVDAQTYTPLPTTLVFLGGVLLGAIVTLTITTHNQR